MQAFNQTHRYANLNEHTHTHTHSHRQCPRTDRTAFELVHNFGRGSVAPLPAQGALRRGLIAKTKDLTWLLEEKDDICMGNNARLNLYRRISSQHSFYGSHLSNL